MRSTADGCRCMFACLMVSSSSLWSHLETARADDIEMIQTVLGREEYLFTPREVWVLRRILELPCESTSTELVELKDQTSHSTS